MTSGGDRIEQHADQRGTRDAVDAAEPVTAPVALRPDPAPTGSSPDPAASAAPRSGRASLVERLTLPVILLFAALVRIPGILWGLPYRLNTDEALITQNAIDLIVRNSFQPTEFARPDHLEFKLDSILFRIYAFFAGSPAPVLYDQGPAVFFGLARSMTVLFSLGAVALAFLVGRRFGRRVGPIAAFLFAFYPPFIANSSSATPDMWLTALLVAVLLTSLRYLERPTWIRLSLCGLMTALAVTVKYPGALGAVSVVAVIVIVFSRTRDRRRAIRHLLLAPVAFLVSLFILSPVLVTDFAEVLRQLSAQSGTGHLGVSGLGYFGRMWFYLDYLGGWLTVVLVAVALFGIWHCLSRREAAAIPVLLLGVVYLLAICSLGLHWYRWGLPVGIALLLFTAIGLDRVVETALASRSRGRPRSRVLGVAAAILLVVAGVSQLTGAAATMGTFAAADTRLTAQPWLAEHGITVENTVFDSYTPIQVAGFRVAVATVGVRDGVVVAKRPEAEYVMISSYIYDRIYSDPRFVKQARVLRAIEQLPLVAEWSPAFHLGFHGLAPLAPWDSVALLTRFAGGGLSGPTIRVYRLTHQTSPSG